MKKKVKSFSPELSYSAPEMAVLEFSAENIVCQSCNAQGLQDFKDSNTLVEESSFWDF